MDLFIFIYTVTLTLVWIYTTNQQIIRHNTAIKELNEARYESAKWKLIAKLHGYKEE